MSDYFTDRSHEPASQGTETGAEGVKSPPDAIQDAAQYEDMQSLMDVADSGFKTLRRRQTTKGVVVSVSDDAVLVDVGTKSEGIISREELVEEGEQPPTLVYGQEVLVQVLEPESPQGPILSLRRARREQSWADMERLVTSGELITAPVAEHNRGGALLDVRGIRGFVPLSQLVSLGPPNKSADRDEDTQARLTQLHGRQLTVKVLEADRSQHRLILSEKSAFDELRATRRAELMSDLKAGQIRSGVVRNVTNYGAFVDLGGADGLVHVSEISYDRSQDPKRVLQSGQEVEVLVLSVSTTDEKISLSIKRASRDPWETIATRYQPGQIVDVMVTKLMHFGAFAQVEPGVEGLIHISELADVAPKEPGHVVSVDQTVEAKITHIDEAARRLGLSVRQVHPSETASSEMTPEQWHAEQERIATPRHSAFDALADFSEHHEEKEQRSRKRAGKKRSTESRDDVDEQVEATNYREQRTASSDQIVEDMEQDDSVRSLRPEAQGATAREDVAIWDDDAEFPMASTEPEIVSGIDVDSLVELQAVPESERLPKDHPVAEALAEGEVQAVTGIEPVLDDELADLNDAAVEESSQGAQVSISVEDQRIDDEIQEAVVEAPTTEEHEAIDAVPQSV